MDGIGAFKGRRVALPGSADFTAVSRLLRSGGAKLHAFTIDSTERAARPLESWIIALFDGEFDDVVFFTAQGVRLIVEYARQLDREVEAISALKAVRKVALGAKVASALREIGLRGDVVSANSTSDSLLSALDNLDVQGRVIGLASLAPDARIAEKLERRGATLRLLSHSTGTDAGAVELFELLMAGGLDAVVFSTTIQVERLWEVACMRSRTNELRAALAKARVSFLGAATELALRQHGIRPDTELSRAAHLRPQLEEIGGILSPALGASEPASEPPPRPMQGPRGKQSIVIVGNGMVGWKLCERLTELDGDNKLALSVFCEEPRPAYDRVNLTSYFDKTSADELLLAGLDWYRERKIRLLLGERAARIHRKQRAVQSSSGEWVPYDVLVLATGSTAFVPPIPGVDKTGVFVYRTIEDLESIRDYAARARRAVVLGGGLLGLEAAKAVNNLGLETEVVEFAPRLMPRQLDAAGARLLARSIRALGVNVHLGRAAQRITGDDCVGGLAFADGESLECDLVVIAAGIRPRDELARQAGLEIGDRGGIVVDDELRTSDRAIYAIGECVLHRGTVYGLVAPGYEMASALGRTLTGEPSKFSGADQSSKLKLLGVDVASFGDPFADTSGGSSITYEDLVKGVYKKLVISDDRTRVLGGVLVGDTSDYTKLTQILRTGQALPDSPEELLFGARSGESAAGALGESAQVCSCNNVTKREICHAIRKGECTTLQDIKQKTRAGTGCGGCLPLVTDLFKAELKASGQVVRENLCEHFAFSRKELYEIVKIKGHRTFEEVKKSHGSGDGCEICKPAIASILASLHNEMILADEHATLQDTNDRFLANLQRTGLYSVVPRVPGGEITPDKLIRLGEIAKKYGLYTKITGGQRIDLFGARLEQLPEIWEELVHSGFESGHAYGKAMRTVKSCVGTTWCRFGVQDSVGFSIRVENRYKGVRAPHKLKAAVSGCVRECAEAQSKDFGLIATEKGWNLYVCGNGGAKPKHAVLLASDLDEATALKFVDRFLMYYIATADRLTRTATWLEKLEGGIEYLRDVVVHDRLGIAEELERQMQYLVDTYRCEWAEVVNDPVKRARFRHFANTTEPDENVALVEERGQKRPREWVKDKAPVLRDRLHLPLLQTSWVKVGRVEDFPKDGGTAVRYGAAQIAVYNFSSRGEWYACQNMCPHMRDMVLARGLLGDQKGVPKVACPQHKKTFSLKTGECLSGDPYKVRTFPVRIENGDVYLELPRPNEIEKLVPVADPGCGATPAAAE